MRYRLLKQEIISTALRMNAAGVNQGTSGNLSVRAEDRILITPSGIPYEDLKPEQIVEMAFDGRVIGEGRPSSEWRFHRDILAARQEVDVVLHAHPRSATALACLRSGIPPFHYMVAVAGGEDIRCAPYASFGTEKLSALALEALLGRAACLLANHGMLVIAGDLKGALDLAIEVETLASQYLQALQVGEPVLLTGAEMSEVLERFKTYRRPASRGRTR
jgi:L-fuculose-phosphate aldolase